MAKTQQQRIVEALTLMKLAKVIPGKSKKYITLKSTAPSYGDDLYFIGKAGSTRYGRTYSTSFPVRDTFKANLIRCSIKADAAPSEK